MAKLRQTGQTARWFLAPLGLGFALLTGCAQTPTASTQPHDPLHGVMTPPGLPQPSSSPRTQGTPTSLPNNNQSFAPIGTENSATNNATLAGLPLGRPLAIDNQGKPQNALAPLAPAPQNVPGYNPRPRVERVPDLQPAKLTSGAWQSEQAGVNAQSGKMTPSTELLTQQLKDRGVINQKVDQLSQGVHLTCYASGGAAGGLRILEVTATDYATAAQAILRQLDKQ